MAKRKTAERTGKARVELRVSDGLYARMKELADRADISVNQLMQGLAEWASHNATLGELEADGHGGFHLADMPGVVCFGDVERRTAKQRATLAKVNGCKVADIGEYGGRINFILDFTERRIVRSGE